MILICVFLYFNLVYDICKQIDVNNDGFISLDELIPYIGENQSQENLGEKNSFNKLWPDWLIAENKICLAKQILMKISDSISERRLNSTRGFKAFDPDNSGLVSEENFIKVLRKLCPDIGNDEQYLLL